MTNRTVHNSLIFGSAKVAAAVALAVGAALLPPQAASAAPVATKTQQSQPAKNNSVNQDKNFVQKVAKGGALQIELSKIEVLQGRKPMVKKFALQTVENMSKAAGMLKAIADNMGMEMPKQPPEDVRKLKRALTADSGKLVDDEYLAQILPASTVAVNVFKDEAQNGNNQKLVHFAKQMLPKLQKHQKMAAQLSQGGGKQNAPQKPSSSSATTSSTKAPGAKAGQAPSSKQAPSSNKSSSGAPAGGSPPKTQP